MGTEEYPLRASRLPGLLRCPMSAVADFLSELSESKPAADTGSAVHMAARAFHGPAKRDVAVSLEVMRQSLPKYPLADLGAAEQQFRFYAQDPRNKEAQIVLLEDESLLDIGGGVFVQGTLDQVRKVRGGLVLSDIKTGSSLEGPDMLTYYCAQLCCYQVMATEVLSEPVARAQIIRTKDYLQRRQGPVFWEAPWALCDAKVILAEVAEIVRAVREGVIRITPTVEGCKWCSLGSVGNCVKRRMKL